jgi:hypothetical protein
MTWQSQCINKRIPVRPRKAKKKKAIYMPTYFKRSPDLKGYVCKCPSTGEDYPDRRYQLVENWLNGKV